MRPGSNINNWKIKILNVIKEVGCFFIQFNEIKAFLEQHLVDIEGTTAEENSILLLSHKYSLTNTQCLCVQCTCVCCRPLAAHLTGIIEQLVLELSDAKDLLEHFVELLLTEDELRHGTKVCPLCLTPHILLPPVNGIILSNPGAQHCLFAQAVDLWEATDASLNVLLEDFAEVVGRAASALNHSGNALTLQEALLKTETMVNLGWALHRCPNHHCCDSAPWHGCAITLIHQ